MRVPAETLAQPARPRKKVDHRDILRETSHARRLPGNPALHQDGFPVTCPLTRFKRLLERLNGWSLGGRDNGIPRTQFFVEQIIIPLREAKAVPRKAGRLARPAARSTYRSGVTFVGAGSKGASAPHTKSFRSLSFTNELQFRSVRNIFLRE